MRTRVRSFTIIEASLATSACLLLTAPAAHAQPSSHCWMDLKTRTSSCYATFADAVEAISAGRVRPSSGQSQLTEAERAQVGAASSFLLGTIYENADYGGASYTFTAGGDCDTLADVDYEAAVMPSGWNDRVSSVRSYGLCQTKLWENGSFGGAFYGPVTNSTYVGATMNDKTSSIQWS